MDDTNLYRFDVKTNKGWVRMYILQEEENGHWGAWRQCIGRMFKEHNEKDITKIKAKLMS